MRLARVAAALPGRIASSKLRDICHVHETRPSAASTSRQVPGAMSIADLRGWIDYDRDKLPTLSPVERRARGSSSSALYPMLSSTPFRTIRS
jgi:hypothetical protein